MISLHDLYEEGTEAVKEAVRSFGARHPLTVGGAEPDWKVAEKHFTHLIEVIMGTAAPAPAQTVAAASIRRAENEAVQLLLALHPVPDYRCPICVKRGRYPL
ncbi:hypothetical protein ACFVFI_27515 [Streptomyces sp. NPDC057705]|uniref:hypothetical protein n=1 Tax=Streptomyces sp. NPDC057705 TaxID=3346222 RepID=UPI00367E157D